MQTSVYQVTKKIQNRYENKIMFTVIWIIWIYTLLNILYFIEQSSTDITNGNIEISCDNEKAGYKSMIDDEKVQITNKHMDLVKAIRKMMKLIKTKVDIQHIYGHQDETVPFSKLSREAQLNIQVDKQAQEALDKAYENQSFIKQPIFYQEGFHVSCITIFK